MMRTWTKNLFAGLLYWSGLLSILIRRRFRGRAVVLTYHRVLPQQFRNETFSHDAIIVSPETFDKHVAALRRHFTCLDLQKFTQCLKRHDLSEQASCLITFDDAWHDNHSHAFPILKRLNIPAVVFVPIDYIGTGKLFWQERLGHLLQAACLHHPDRARETLQPHGWEFLIGLPRTRQTDEIKSVIRSIKHKDYSEIGRIITDLETILDAVPVDYGPDTYLTVEQMHEMQRNGISFQSHGCSHRVLTRLGRQEVRREMDDSRRWLAQNLGTVPLAHAYPNGDHDTVTAECCAESGYQLAFTTVYGHVTPHSDPYAIRRININDNAAPNEARLLLNLYLSG